jgi:glutathione synthase/RimK-type ligase-like ATP-grasp enzyme
MKDQSFIIQPFIPSKVELRLLMINYQPLIILQKDGDTNGQEFRKNLSRTNKLSLLEGNDVDESYPGLVKDCQKISENLKLKLCAFDIIIDEKGDYKFLEINSVPGWTYLENFINSSDVERNLTREILEHIIK